MTTRPALLLLLLLLSPACGPGQAAPGEPAQHGTPATSATEDPARSSDEAAPNGPAAGGNEPTEEPRAPDDARADAAGARDAGEAAARTTAEPAAAPPGDEAARPGGWRLADADSPYLRQHADNPVRWYPWGDEAFERARELDRPVFLSIGYSSCHWCHVMEHETFEDPGIAALLAETFVSIKVDREQHPAVDSHYMDAVVAMTGRGGWPMTVFMTPEGEPFFGGTYFPPEDRFGRPGFRRLVEFYAKAWEEERETLLQQAGQVREHLLSRTRAGAGELDADAVLAEATEVYLDAFDPELGGLAGGPGAPKFPPSMALRFMMRRHLRTGVDVDDVLAPTLDAMATGGMFDHVGGGFHRYAVDPRWEVPHFEKMLYDNAQLVATYVEAYALTGAERHARTARRTLAWLLGDMRSPEGLFYAARDADSAPWDDPDGHKEEGLVYLWTPEQVRAVLGEEDGARFAAMYRITEEGNFEGGRSIPRPFATLEELAAERGEDPEALAAWLEDARARLLAHRETRPQAFRDEKCLTSWNGLMLEGMARAACLLDDAALREETARLADAMLEHLLREDGTVFHQRFEGRSSGDGTLADHAAFARGLIEAHAATGEPRLLLAALDLADVILERFGNPEGGFHDTLARDPRLPTRGRDVRDGARPSGHTLACDVLVHLAPLDDEDRARAAVADALDRVAGRLRANPTAMPGLLSVVDAWRGPLAEVVLDGEPGDPAYDALLAEAATTFLPADLLLPSAGALARAWPPARPAPSLLEGRRAVERPTAWVCERGVCLLPVHAPAGLAEQWPAVTRPGD